MYHKPTMTMRGYYRMEMAKSFIDTSDQTFRFTYCEEGALYYWSHGSHLQSLDFMNWENVSIDNQSLEPIVELVNEDGYEKHREFGYYFEYVIPLEYTR